MWYVTSSDEYKQSTILKAGAPPTGAFRAGVEAVQGRDRSAGVATRTSPSRRGGGEDLLDPSARVFRPNSRPREPGEIGTRPETRWPPTFRARREPPARARKALGVAHRERRTPTPSPASPCRAARSATTPGACRPLVFGPASNAWTATGGVPRPTRSARRDARTPSCRRGHQAQARTTPALGAVPPSRERGPRVHGAVVARVSRVSRGSRDPETAREPEGNTTRTKPRRPHRRRAGCSSRGQGDALAPRHAAWVERHSAGDAAQRGRARPRVREGSSRWTRTMSRHRGASARTSAHEITDGGEHSRVCRDLHQNPEARGGAVGRRSRRGRRRRAAGVPGLRQPASR